MEDALLEGLMRPGRYIGAEWNVCRKDFTQCQVRVALCFPDLYEVGMSNLGMRVLYGMLNAQDNVGCERCFAPAQDCEQRLLQTGALLGTLETGMPLKQFDLVGFSLGHELAYPNVLMMLERGGIPLEAAGRTDDDPLVIGGGPCTLNPEPMHAFFDAFIIGEAEEALAEVAQLLLQTKSQPRAVRLTALGRIQGVYVPSWYEIAYTDQGGISSRTVRVDHAPARVSKRIVQDFENAFFPASWVVPYIQIVHDRITVEVARGCPNVCRFCQARSQYFPLRQRSAERVLELCRSAYGSSGYEELALGGLSVSDYPHLSKVLGPLMVMCKPLGVGVSLPSLKARDIVGEVSALIATVKKTGLTFAPEAGTARLRELLAKNFDEEEFFRMLGIAYANGYQHVKLYFMTGIPTESLDDLEGIASFAVKVSEARRAAAGKPAQVNMSVNTLIPKPHTPLQWYGMLSIEEMRKRQDVVKARAFRNKRLRVSFHPAAMSFWEGVLSRGDRRLSAVIRAAYEAGARFDSWDDQFNPGRWQESCARCGVDPKWYTDSRAVDALLPWDVIDTGVSGEYLKQEFNKTVAG
jgi:radical SAM family uncharacterized protein